MSNGPAPVPGTAGGASGAQWERTRLAWRRTSLTFAVAAALAVRSVVYDGGPVAYAMAALGALVWLLFLGLAHHRIRCLTLREPDDVVGAPLRVAVRVTVVCTLAMAVLGVVLLLWRPAAG